MAEEAQDTNGQPLMADDSFALEYKPFDGICITDTFQLGEEGNDILEDVFPQKSRRVNLQKRTPITVIIGDLPYFVGQDNANDDAQNQHYERLEGCIAETNVATGTATNKNVLYEFYIKVFRWASDRISNKDKKGKDRGQGVIGFVTNDGWLEGTRHGQDPQDAREGVLLHLCVQPQRKLSNIGKFEKERRRKCFWVRSRTPVAVTIRSLY